MRKCKQLVVASLEVASQGVEREFPIVKFAMSSMESRFGWLRFFTGNSNESPQRAGNFPGVMPYRSRITPGEVTQGKTRRTPCQEFRQEQISEPQNCSELYDAAIDRRIDDS